MRKFFSNLWSMTPTGFLRFLPLSAVYPPSSCAVKNSTRRFRTGPRQRGSLGAFTSLALLTAWRSFFKRSEEFLFKPKPRSWLETSHPRFYRFGLDNLSPPDAGRPRQKCLASDRPGQRVILLRSCFIVILF